MIKQNEPVLKRKSNKQQARGVIADFNRALHLLSVHFDQCLVAINTRPDGQSQTLGQRPGIKYNRSGISVGN